MAGARRWWLILGAVLAGAAVVCAVVVVRGAEGGEPGVERQARTAGERFLDRYVDEDGRVVRRDQGDDTVSEGQAYAMLVAVALGDQARFSRVWGWTTHHLQRPDGLLSWHWQDGAVVDPQSAADADVETARALLLAAERFGQPAYRRAGERIAGAILRVETVTVGSQRVLMAGPWARSLPAWIDPSYFIPGAFRLLYRTTGDARWRAVNRSSLSLLEHLTEPIPHLPPDWARLSFQGLAIPAPAPAGGGMAEFGLDAVRVPVQMAEDCRPAGRRIAASLWPFFRQAATSGIVTRYDLQGHPLTQDRHPTGWVAAAAAAEAAGHQAWALSALDHAQRMEAQHSTYYGAAWVALGRILLTTRWLGGCGS